MQLYVFRHGIAEPADPGIPGSPGSGMRPDADRPLSPLGIERTLAAAQGLARFADRPNVILTSPKDRARQTAGILGDLFDLTPQIAAVLAEGPAVDVIHMLRQRDEDRVLIVGHEPTLSEVIETLCTHKTLPGFIELKKAACALVDAPLHPDDAPGPGVLKWLLPPRALRALGGDVT
jgi:phosphohistidine phosphatase